MPVEICHKFQILLNFGADFWLVELRPGFLSHLSLHTFWHAHYHRPPELSSKFLYQKVRFGGRLTVWFAILYIWQLVESFSISAVEYIIIIMCPTQLLCLLIHQYVDISRTTNIFHSSGHVCTSILKGQVFYMTLLRCYRYSFIITHASLKQNHRMFYANVADDLFFSKNVLKITDANQVST